jgi:hypothetical protein
MKDPFYSKRERERITTMRNDWILLDENKAKKIKDKNQKSLPDCKSKTLDQQREENFSLLQVTPASSRLFLFSPMAIVCEEWGG